MYIFRSFSFVRNMEVYLYKMRSPNLNYLVFVYNITSQPEVQWSHTIINNHKLTRVIDAVNSAHARRVCILYLTVYCNIVRYLVGFNQATVIFQFQSYKRERCVKNIAFNLFMGHAVPPQTKTMFWMSELYHLTLTQG